MQLHRADASPIEHVPNHRVPDCLKVNANLVGTAGFQTALEKTTGVNSPNPPNVGNGRFAGWFDGHQQSVLWRSRQRRFDARGSLREPAFDHRNVSTPGRASLNLAGQHDVGGISFRHHK